MSKIESTQAKAARRGVTDQHPVGGRNKRPRPWVVWIRIQLNFLHGPFDKWFVKGRYRSEHEARKVAADLMRKSAVPVRVEGPPGSAQ